MLEQQIIQKETRRKSAKKMDRQQADNDNRNRLDESHKQEKSQLHDEGEEEVVGKMSLA